MAYPPSGFVFQTHDEDDDLLPSSCPLQHLQPFLMKRSMSFSGVDRCEETVLHGDDEYSDDGSQLGEKKKRLSLEQVKTLEKSFELGNKLDPERKLQLAKALGLQPRQVAIWFQNRRARWKTKQLEKDYVVLRKQFDALKADNDSLHAQNKKLQAEFLALKRDCNNLKKDTEGCWSNGSDNSCDVNLDVRTPVSTQLSSKCLFPSSIKPANTTRIVQVLTTPDQQCLKIDRIVQDESFCCNVFGNIEDQPGIWPWPGQQQFH